MFRYGRPSKLIGWGGWKKWLGVPFTQSLICLVATPPNVSVNAHLLARGDFTVSALWLLSEMGLPKKEKKVGLKEVLKSILEATAVEEEGTKIYDHIHFSRHL